MRAKKVDANQAEVVDYLRSVGWVVFVTSGLGGGYPDLHVSREGFAALVEIKDGSKPPSARQLTKAERGFMNQWQGPYVLACDEKDAEQQLNTLMWRARAGMLRHLY